MNKIIERGGKKNMKKKKILEILNLGNDTTLILIYSDGKTEKVNVTKQDSVNIYAHKKGEKI